VSVGISFHPMTNFFVLATCCLILFKKKYRFYSLRGLYREKECENTISIVQQVCIYLKCHKNIFTHLIRFSVPHISLY